MECTSVVLRLGSVWQHSPQSRHFWLDRFPHDLLVLNMNLLSLWNSMFQSSRRPVRRKTANESRFGFIAAEVLEFRELLAAAVVPNITLTVQGSNLTLASTDVNNPNFTVTRSGNSVVVTGLNGTTITNGTKVAASQTVVLAAVNNLTVNLGTGSDTATITGLSVTGNITINGQSSGIANLAISAGAPSVVIGGSIQANLGGEAATFNLFGSPNGGGSLTVNGSVNVTEAGAGAKQVNLYGPPASNPTGGKLIVKGGVGVVDTGTGQSGLRIDDGVTIGGNVSYDNSTNTVNGDNVQIYSNSNSFGTTSIAGSLTLALSQSVYHGNVVVIEGFGASLAVTGAVKITSGGGSDSVQLMNDWFKSTTQINTGINPSFSRDIVGINGSRFDGAVTISETGPYAELDLGTNAQFGPTTFNGTFAAALTGASSTVLLSNATSTVNQVVFNSTAAITGGTPFGTLLVQGNYMMKSGKLATTNFNKPATAPAIVPDVTLVVQGSNVTLTSADINNHNFTITRSGNSIVVTGLNGTVITNGTKVAATQTVVLAAVNNLTINLGTGNDTVAITGLSVTGNITINGQSSGMANVEISAGTPNVVIGGSIQANLGGEAGTVGVFGSFNGGGSLTVNGSVNITEGGAGAKQVNIYGPPANNPTGGKLAVKGNITVLDTGSGQSNLHIDDGVTIGGNVSYNNSANTVGGDNVQIYSNSISFGTTSIAGSLTLALSQSVYQGDVVIVEGFGTSLPVTGAVNIASGAGNDSIQLMNDWFKSTTQINTGTNPSFSRDIVGINGSRFDGAVTISETGPYAELDLGTNSQFGPTTFNSTFAAGLTGASSTVLLSNAASTVNQVVFNSTAALTGGTPFGTLVIQGKYGMKSGKITKTNFN
ncbi:MAG TPA: hypothetical protein VGM05_13355 [Planctomycetaceae bacterium]